MNLREKFRIAAFFFTGVLAFACSAGNDAAADENGSSTFRRQSYPLNADKVQRNRARLDQALNSAPQKWKGAPVAYFTVPPLGAEPYLPDELPEEAKAFAELEIIGAKGEFEPASFLIYPRQGTDRLEIVPGTLRDRKTGAEIPAENLDVKMVKLWYKSGSAWYGMFVDPLRRRLIPELLLNDENLVYADPEKQENYLLMTSPDGSCRYEWASGGIQTRNWKTNEPNYELITDAPTFRGVVLNPDELKQIILTVKIPENAQAGLYTGELKLTAEGKTNIPSLPIRLRVLPFSLPSPKTATNLEKDFHVSFYGSHRAGGLNEKRAQNCADHNVKSLLGYPSTNPFQRERAELDAQIAKKTGMNTGALFSAGVGCGMTVAENPTVAQKAQLKNLETRLFRLAELTKRLYGHTNFYSYGVDEGDAGTVRAQQEAWKLVRKAGGKTMVTTYPRGELLFNLDMVNLPFSPHSPLAAEAVRRIHAANPDAVTAWYSNPHTGPENPDFTRRFYGLVPYANGFDANMQYAMLNHNVKMWNEFGDTYESDRRSHSIVYPTRDDYVDTLAWEGLREGIDDIRYLTLLRLTAEQASADPNPDTRILARKILTKLACMDFLRRDADAVRMDAVSLILSLRNAMNPNQEQ